MNWLWSVEVTIWTALAVFNTAVVLLGVNLLGSVTGLSRRDVLIPAIAKFVGGLALLWLLQSLYWSVALLIAWAAVNGLEQHVKAVLKVSQGMRQRGWAVTR